MASVIEGKYKLIKDYTSIEGALYTNEVVNVYDNNNSILLVTCLSFHSDAFRTIWFEMNA